MDGLAVYFDVGAQEALSHLPLASREQATEIRLRAGRPLSVVVEGKAMAPLNPRTGQPVVIGAEELKRMLRKMCEFSLYTHQEEMQKGYLTLRGGHRVGLAGTAVYTGGQVTGLRELSSMNIRIAREVFGSADKLIPYVKPRLHSLLIAGPPGSGKTTVLRDLLRQLGDSGLPGIALVDQRGEIAAVKDGIAQNQVGDCCDILTGYSRGEGIQMALRNLGPAVIACDEIGEEEDVQAILSGANSGVCFFATIHGERLEQLERKTAYQELQRAKVFDYVVLLRAGNGNRVHQILQVGDGR